jgi:spore coat protein CotH
MKRHIQLGRLLALALFALVTAPASAVGWPGLYDPMQVFTLHLDMDWDDWATIKGDTTYSIEVPAMLSADEEALWVGGDPEKRIKVSVRRKSADVIGDKVSLKIDINEYVDQQWNGVKKLSLENGDDVDVVAEGFAWYLHRVAAAASNSGYNPGLAAWIRLYVNGDYVGVYLNVEQPDKTFLKNRGLYTMNETWLYKASSVGANYELKVGDPNSPTSAKLCYSPFGADGGGKGKGKKGGGTGTTCEAPEGDAAVTAELDALIDMQAMLTQGAVEAFTKGPDALFSKGKNFYFADFSNGKQRLYIPWDLDTVFVSQDPEGSIYATEKKKGRRTTESQSPYQELILNNPAFRERYNQIMTDLLNGPMSEAEMNFFLDDLELLLTSDLQADPNNNIDGSIAERFASLRQWIKGRVADIQSQLSSTP